jgi:hypothetical protein
MKIKLSELKRIIKEEAALNEKHWGSKDHEYRRSAGHRAGEGPKGHYKDDEGTWGEDEDEESRTHPGEEDYTGHKRDHSKTDPGEEDYTWRKHESYRATAEQLRGIIEEEMKALLDKE